MNSTSAIIAGLLIGLVLGGGGVYLIGGASGGGSRTVTSTSTLTSTTTASATGVSADEFRVALNNTVAPDLTISSYSFGKGTLTAWVVNNGSEPFVITSHVPFLNGSTDSVATVISTDPNVVRVGSYLFVPPGGTVIVSVDAGSYLPGNKGVLSIYEDSWTFVYGTQKD